MSQLSNTSLQNDKLRLRLFINDLPIDTDTEIRLNRKIEQLIATQDRNSKREADRRTLETIAALLNGDANQVEVVQNYVHNKLLMYKHQADSGKEKA